MTVYASQSFTPTGPLAIIQWMFGWRHVGGKLSGRDSQNARPRDCADTIDHGPDVALQIATVWACIRLIAETISTLPMVLYRSAADGGREVAYDHPLYELLHDAPHFDFTAVEFWEGVAASLCTGGNAYAEKLFIGDRLVALRPLPWAQVEVYRTARGARGYRFHEDNRRGREIPEENMFHVRGFGNCGDLGLSPISYARRTLYASRMTEYASSKLYGDNMRHSGVLKMANGLSAEQRPLARQNILDPILQGGSAILEHGMEFQPLTMSAQDAQMLETRSFQVEEICRWFRVPPFMVGHTQKSTSWGSGLEQQNIGFLIYSLRPYLSRIEQSIRRSLIPPAERKTITAEFKVEGLLRGDSTARMKNYAVGVQNGIYSRDEVRGWENLPPKGGMAAELTVQSQNVPIGEEVDESPASRPELEEEAA